GSNFGNIFIPLKGFDERRSLELHSDVIAARLRKRFNDEIPDAIVAVFGPPPVSGLGTAGGFQFLGEERGDLGLTTLQAQTDNLIARGNQQPGLDKMFTVFRANAPQLDVKINREQCFRLGVQLGDVFDTLQIYLGSLYVNDLNLFGRTWQV